MNDDQLLRYSRHILLDEVGIEGQQRLLDARALMIGGGVPKNFAQDTVVCAEILGHHVRAAFLDVVGAQVACQRGGEAAGAAEVDASFGTLRYTAAEVERVAEVAFRLARGRREVRRRDGRSGRRWCRCTRRRCSRPSRWRLPSPGS